MQHQEEVEDKKEQSGEYPFGSAASSPSWAELLGSGRWSGLLEPLDPSVRRLVLRCGDLCQVTYDAFVSDEHSKYCGACRYGKRNLLPRCMVPFAGDYAVSEYLYATSQQDLPIAFLFSLSREAWSKESNWIGYVAVSSDDSARVTGRRDIFVAWRGTIRDLEWVDVLHPKLVPINTILDTNQGDDDEDEEATPKVMEGWYTIYTSSDAKSPFNRSSARDQLLARIKQLTQQYKEERLSIICVGHSLGASLAVLSAFDIVHSGLSKIDDANNGGGGFFFPVCAVVFGGPQVGNKAFNDRLEKLPNLRVLRVKNKIDLIPLYPTGLLGYVDTAGIELVVDTRKSPFLKDSNNPSDWHNLQGMLHAVAGWNGEGEEFELKAVKRSVGLVNKSCDYLKDELLVPGSWWVEKNRGMVMGGDGEWGLGPLDEDDLPIPPATAASSAKDSIAHDDDHHHPMVDSNDEINKKKARGMSGLYKCASCFRGV